MWSTILNLFARRAVRNTVLVAVLAALAAAWWWPVGRSPDEVDVVILGDGPVLEAADELERRFRQEGMVPLVVELDPDQCPDLASAYASATIGHEVRGATVVLSLSEWSLCDGDMAVDLLVQHPGGPLPTDVESSRGVRPSAPMFTPPPDVPQPGDMSCYWWDTPGAGEARPGLGQCRADGFVQIVDDEGLTAAGRERFARMVVEALA